ncbi:phosphohydrolase [Massilia sp. ST3]|uniref:phosphohydrolase n=1 Tax=Massilia sp. ST3 TaxID=2824903 RepID=UPI001B81E4ED|nr:phosphohydrolase [Massilia sp. ST3]MBQ5949949.1 phosphohydrolase [Massilia sp. ST3]
MPSGRRLDLLDPTPFDWDDADLALGLARTYRWGGHSAWPLPLSVAQHSITVMLLRRAAGPVSPLEELRELLHDAEEGLLGFDAISVIKPFLGEAFRDLTRRLEHAVFLRYGLPAWEARAHAAHKRADRLAAATEAVHVAGWSIEEVRRTLKIRAAVLDADPLALHYGCTPWEPWPPALASERFLAELERLKHAVQLAPA